MRVELIAIGDELTSGRILNSTGGYAARRLFLAGHRILAMQTIGDDPELIGATLVQAIKRADCVLVTGGLGPTDDDLTNEAVSRALDRPVDLYPVILSQLEERLGREGCQNLDKLAWLPQGAELISPDSRSAGHLLIHDQTPIFFLPGVPRQMRHLMDQAVLPWLTKHSPGLGVQQRVYRFFDVREMVINQEVLALGLPPEVEIGYYPVQGEVHLSVTVQDHDHRQAEQLFRTACARIEEHFGSQIYGRDQEDLATVLGGLLLKRGLTLALAESCTGGLVSSQVTGVAGSSSYFLGGVVSYANSMKEQALGVPPELLERHGAVSREVAMAMAQGLHKLSRADLCLSVTGIAGPSGGTADKPVGTVYMGLHSPQGVQAQRFQFSGDRQKIQAITAQTGLDLIRRHLLTFQVKNH